MGCHALSCHSMRCVSVSSHTVFSSTTIIAASTITITMKHLLLLPLLLFSLVGIRIVVPYCTVHPTTPPRPTTVLLLQRQLPYLYKEQHSQQQQQPSRQQGGTPTERRVVTRPTQKRRTRSRQVLLYNVGAHAPVGTAACGTREDRRASSDPSSMGAPVISITVHHFEALCSIRYLGSTSMGGSPRMRLYKYYQFL